VEEPNFFSSDHNPRAVFFALAHARPEARARALELVPEAMRDPWDFEMRSISIANEFRGQVPGAMQAVEAAPERFHERLRTVVFEALAPDYPVEARQWLSEHPELREKLAAGSAGLMPLISDAERGRIIEENHFADGKWGRGLLVDVTDFAAHLGEANPVQAVKWMNRLPEPARVRPAILLATNWSAYAPDDAAAWVQSLPAGPTRDAAAGGMAVSLRHDAEEALHWAKQITEPETQFQMVKRLVQDWARADLQTAAWLADQAALSEAQHGELKVLMEQEAIRRGGAE
jgi:hypothetical protein